MPRTKEIVWITNFAYGGWACFTSFSQNGAFLLKRHDSLFLSLQSARGNAKVALAFSIPQFENSGFNLKSNIIICWKLNGTIFISRGDRDRKVQVSGRTRATHFGAKLKAQNVSFFFFFSLSHYEAFCIKNPISEVFNAVFSEKGCPISLSFLLTSNGVRTVHFFPAESFIQRN